MTNRVPTPALLVALLLPTALLGGALVSQYMFGLAPCEMCYWQRYPHAIACVLALGALGFRQAPIGRPLLILAAVAIALSGLIGAFHAGVEYGWWEGLTRCATDGLPTGADPLDAIMAAPVTRCDVPAWTLFGISLAGYNFFFSIGGALLISALVRKR